MLKNIKYEVLCLDKIQEETTEYENILAEACKGIDGMDSVIMKYNQPEITSALSETRWNCVEWLEIRPSDKILVLGSGYGELTGLFAQRAEEVFCVDSSTAKSNINEARNRHIDNVHIYVAYMEQLEREFENEKFDQVYMVGCLSVAKEYYRSPHKTYMDMVRFAASHLTDGGKIVIMEDNKYGIKYFDGTRTDGTGDYFCSFLSQKQGRHLFSKQELGDIMKSLGMEHRVYYPYPDYKFAECIFSDDFLPHEGQLDSWPNTWERGKIDLFQQGRVLEQMSNDGVFSSFSNSFLIVVSNRKADLAHLPAYLKYSSERNDSFRIRTEIYGNSSGQRKVLKRPLSRFSEEHINNMLCFYERMKEKYSRVSDIHYLECKKRKEGIEFDYIEGRSLINIVKQWAETEDEEGIIQVFDRLNRFLLAGASSYFIACEKFREVFGEADLPSNLKCSARDNNMDLILGNIIVSADGCWHIIDYEWIFDFPVPIKYILYRSVFYALRENENMMKKICSIFGIDEQMRQSFQNMEKSFQSYILNGRAAIYEMGQAEHIKLFQKPAELFFDVQGEGWSLQNRRKLNAVLGPDHKLSMCIPISADWKQIRIDPTTRNCVIKIDGITDSVGNEVAFMTNGEQIGESSYLYKTNDPQIEIKTTIWMKTIRLDLKVYELDEKL